MTNSPPESTSPEESNDALVRAWVEAAIIGLNLCPFAASPYKRQLVHISECESANFDDAVGLLLDETDALITLDASDRATTLVVFPHGFEDFEDFMELVGACDALYDKAGVRGVLQLAHFHPDYRFAGERQDALSNYTNRAPFPVIHIIRESDISDAALAHPDLESIPTTNIARLEEMGRASVEALWGAFMPDESP